MYSGDDLVPTHQCVPPLLQPEASREIHLLKWIVLPLKRNNMTRRRDVLTGLVTLPLTGVATGDLLAQPAPDKDFERDYFKELGLRTFINAAGTYTALTASFIHPEVVKAYNYAALQFVKLEDMQDKVGERLAELLKCEAAMVTSGAASAITLGTAAILTGGDPSIAERIPIDM